MSPHSTQLSRRIAQPAMRSPSTQHSATPTPQSPMCRHPANRRAVLQLHALQHQRNWHKLGQQAAKLATQMSQRPLAEQSLPAWLQLARLAEDAGRWDVVRHTLYARHALLTADEQNHHDTVRARTRLALALAETYEREEKPDEVAEWVLQAIDHLQQDANCDYREWLNWAEDFLRLYPACGGKLIDAVRSRVPADLCQAKRREVEVRLARIEAHLHYHQGKLAAALDAAWRGRYCLHDDDGQDTFNQQLIEWLLEAGDQPAAALLTLESAYCFGTRTHPDARTRALAQLTVERSQPEWHLALSAQLPDDHHSAHIHAAMPGTPAGNALTGMRLAHHGGDHHALPLLESACAQGEWVSDKLLCQLLRCRLQVLGVQATLNRALPFAASAYWNYSFATTLELHGTRLLDELRLSAAQQDQLHRHFQQLALQYYRRALAQFEAFFTTGHGHLLDGDVRVYSLLCLQLAQYYLRVRQRPDLAAMLHDKGCAVFPLAEHFTGLLQCYAALHRPVAYVDTAERLWQYVQTHAQARHQPLRYIAEVCQQLHGLRRSDEIVPWLTRLNLWWQQQAEAAQQSQLREYVGCKLQILSLLAARFPESTVQRLESCLPSLKALGEAEYFKLAGMVYMLALRPQQAEAMFTRGLALCPPDSRGMQRLRRELRRCLQHVNRPRTRWWHRLGACTTLAT